MSDFSIVKPDYEPFDDPVIYDEAWNDSEEETKSGKYDDNYKAMCLTYLIAHRAGMSDGITYAQAGRALHVSPATLSKWLKDYKEHGGTVNDNVQDLLNNQVVALDMKLNSLLGASIELLTERVSKGLVDTSDLIKLVSSAAKTKQGLHESRVDADLKEKQIEAEKESMAGGMRSLVSGLSALGDLKDAIEKRISESDVIEGVVIEDE